MSYASRAKKRAIAAAKYKKSDVMKGRHYLTIVTRKTCCARCAGLLKLGAEMVYRHTPREALCTLCATADPSIHARPSTRWTDQRRRAPRPLKHC